ncbi:Collectin-10 Precursor [Triplophysa tibetana]|uniref:Collectin-10 n=1 Tax=Triplophysa tibetana TaxID=1572043 RepID=A0A5A9PBT6_9TELE|nr:Collectin-10 Precursor [Triplophysa tibetana]
MMDTVDPGYNGSVWIGLNRSAQARWVWSTENNSISQYSNWGVGEPNGSRECVKSSNGNWFDVDCALTLPFVCFNGLLNSASGRWLDYHYINQNKTWSEAQSYCGGTYANLATVDSMKDVNRIMNIVGAGYSGSVWIGLKRATQSRWETGQQDNHQHLVTVLSCQQMTLENGLMTAVM